VLGALTVQDQKMQEHLGCWFHYSQAVLKWSYTAPSLSQRDRATLRVIEYFAKSLKITQGHSKRHCRVWRVRISISIPLKLCLYLVPFLRYLASKNGVTLKPEVWVAQGH